VTPWSFGLWWIFCCDIKTLARTGNGSGNGDPMNSMTHADLKDRGKALAPSIAHSETDRRPDW
jgi:hypothetical protein